MDLIHCGDTWLWDSSPRWPLKSSLMRHFILSRVTSPPRPDLPRVPYSLLLCTKQQCQLQGKVLSVASCYDHLNQHQHGVLHWESPGLSSMLPNEGRPQTPRHCPEHWGPMMAMLALPDAIHCSAESWEVSLHRSCTILLKGFTFSAKWSLQKEVIIPYLVLGGLNATVFWRNACIWYLFSDRLGE